MNKKVKRKSSVKKRNNLKKSKRTEPVRDLSWENSLQFRLALIASEHPHLINDILF